MKSMQTLSHYTARAAELCFRTDCWIGGRSVPAASGARFPSVDPATGATLAEVARGGAEDVDRAVASARAAFADGRWSRQTPGARKEVLLRLAALIREHLEELALTDTLDMGKPISETVNVDVPGSAHFFQWHAEAVDKIYDEVAPTGGRDLAMIRRVPLGVVGAVVPWNFPLDMATWKLAPALAAGNSVVLKPAEQSPLSALRLAELAAQAGLPDGVLNVVPGFGEEAGEALGRHADVDCLVFTGSTGGGRLTHRRVGRVHRADDLRRRAARRGDRAGGDLRAGARGAELPRRRRGGGDRQRLGLRAGRLGLDARPRRALDVSDRLVAGTVSVNTVDALSAMTPFGGMKQSGFGRDLSLHSFDKYTALKTVWIRY